MSNRGKLKAVLTVVAVGFGLSALGVIAPWSWLAGWARAFGVEGLLPMPVLVYAVRVGSVGAFFIGVFFALLARDPERFAPFVDLAIAGLLLTGLVCLITGATAHMPALWYLSDFVFCTVPALLIAAWRKPGGAF